MTCIIGCIDNDSIYIGGDSVGTDDELSFGRKDEKVFIRDNGIDRAIFGFVNSYRFGQLLRYTWKFPERAEGQTLEEYIYTDFISSIVRMAKKHYFYGDQTSGEEVLCGIGNKLFCIGIDFQIEEYFDKFICIGCGQHMAIGAMEALPFNMPTLDKIRTSLRIVSKYNTAVGPPFVIKSLKISV